MKTPVAQPAVQDGLDLEAIIAPALQVVPLSLSRRLYLQDGVLARIRSSAQAHRHFTTIRREDGAWLAVSPGVEQCLLNVDDHMHICLLQAEPDAPIAWPGAAFAQELLVVQGTLEVSLAGQTPSQVSPLGALVLAREADAQLRAGSTGVSLYVRRRMVDLACLPTPEAHWWIAAESQRLPENAAGFAWDHYLEGVESAALQVHEDVASMLIRIAPGSQVPDHGHSLNEDCFMLEGDMFLGDILMRAGDFQRAPIGCQHVAISSDTGGVFYFHGALPPAASETPA